MLFSDFAHHINGNEETAISDSVSWFCGTFFVYLHGHRRASATCIIEVEERTTHWTVAWCFVYTRTLVCISSLVARFGRCCDHDGIEALRHEAYTCQNNR